MLVQLTAQHFVTDARDQGVLLLRHFVRAQHTVGTCGGRLQNGKGADDRQRHTLATDGEVFQAALGLRTPIFVGWDEQLAHGIVFGSVIHIETSALVYGYILAQLERDFKFFAQKKRADFVQISNLEKNHE
jgi:hypothetical protein